MKAVFDCSSESFANLIDILSQCSWIDSEERQKILILSPYMTPQERQQISDSLMIEAGQIKNSLGL